MIGIAGTVAFDVGVDRVLGDPGRVPRVPRAQRLGQGRDRALVDHPVRFEAPRRGLAAG
jgi:hypothetical protein